jgi:hypothetical protein
MASRVTINTNSLNVPWSLGTTYRIALDAGFVAEPDNNRSGNPAVNNLVTFTTNASRPELNSTNPSNGDNDVTNNTSITLTFSRNVEAGPGTIRLYRADNTDELIYTYNMGDPAWVTISNTTVTLKTTGLLREEELYLLLIDNNAIRDLDNFTYLGSRTAKTITAAGNAQWNNTESKFGGTASIQFDGVGDYVTVATASDFAWNTNTFTWEAWIKKTSVTGTQAIFDQRTASLLNNGYLYTAGTQLIYQAAGSARITSASSVIQNNTWYNIMLTRDITGTTKLYVNGTQVGSSYTDSNNYAQAPVIIGADYLGSNGFVGYMEDIRFRKLISGATALPTKYRVNDPDTVLHIIQSGEAVNGSQTIEDNVSTVQFDTASQSQGFRGLSANLTGAFAPTFSIRYVARFITVMGMSATFTCANTRLRRATITMNSVNAFTVSARVDYAISKTFNSVFTQSVNFDRFRAGTSNLSTITELGFPWQNVYNFDGGMSFNTQFGHKIHLNSANQLFVGSNPSSGTQSPKFYELSNSNETLSGTQFSSPRYGAQSMNDTYILIKNNSTNYIELYSVSNRSSALRTFTSVGTSINSVAVGNTYSLLANTSYNSGTGIIYVVNNNTGALVSTISAQPNLGVGGSATVGWGEYIALNDTHCVVGTGMKGIVFQLSDGTEKGYLGGGKTFGGNSTHLVDINNNYVAVSKDGDVFLLDAQSSTFDYVRTISSHGDANYGTTGAVRLNDTHVFVSGSAAGQGYLTLNAHLQSNGNLVQSFNDIVNPGANNSQFPGNFAVNNKYIAVSDVKSNTFTGKMYIIRKIGV